MSIYRTQQHRLVHRGQSFHFVSYEGQPADEKRQQPEMPPSWYLMLAGRRRMVSPQVAGASPDDLDRQFGAWLDVHVFGDAPAVQSQQPPSADAATNAAPAAAQRATPPSARARPQGTIARRA
jgi:hypothetical protein